MTYTVETKLKAVNYLNSGATIRATALKFGASEASVNNWKKRYAKTTAPTPNTTSAAPTVTTDAVLFALRNENAKLKTVIADLYLKQVQ